MDEGLRRGAAAAALADANHPRRRAVFQNFRVDQIIDQDHLGLLQCTHCLEGQQFRVAGTRADQPDLSAHASSSDHCPGGATAGQCIRLSRAMVCIRASGVDASNSGSMGQSGRVALSFTQVGSPMTIDVRCSRMFVPAHIWL
ncbi:hypothetical protein D3C80_1537490 [compost metagenome]